MRRKIENVIFHDPGRNDEHRLGPDLVGRRRILNELDQSIAINDLARGHRYIAPNDIILGANGLLAACRAFQILHQVAQAAHQVLSTFADGMPKQLGICQQEVRRREHVEHLARHEIHHVLMVFRHAADTRRRVVPPLLIEQEALIHQTVWPSLPFRANEPSIIRQWLDTILGLVALQPALPSVVGEADGFPGRLIEQLQPFARRKGKMGCPIKIGFGQCRRRQAHGETRRRGMERAVDDLGKSRHGIGIAPVGCLGRSFFARLRNENWHLATCWLQAGSRVRSCEHV